MGLPNVLTNDSWHGKEYKTFLAFIKRKVAAGLKEITLTIDDVKKEKLEGFGDRFNLSSVGGVGQILQWEKENFIWKVTNTILKEGEVISVTLVKISSTELVRYERITDVELYNRVYKRTSGLLAVGVVVIDGDGDAFKVKDIFTEKIKNEKKSYQDEVNNPLRKEIWEDMIMVEVYLEQGVKDKDGSMYWLPNADFGEKTKKYTLEEFSEKFAITTFTTIEQLNKSLNDAKAGIGFEDIINVEDNEQSNSLVSTSNKDFLQNLAVTTDKRRNAAMVLQNSLNRVVELKKRELDIQRRALDAMMREQKAALELMYAEAQRAIEVFRKQLKKIQRLITTLEIYLGVHEKVFQISEGEPAKDTEPIHLFQQFKYMDEEYGDPNDGGLDFSMIEQWDEWLVQDRNFEKIVPVPKGVCLLQVRRYPKDRGGMHPSMVKRFEELDEFVYVIIRNGDNIYRIWSDEIGGDERQVNRLFPKRSEVQDMLDAMQADIDKYSNEKRWEDKKAEYVEKQNEKVENYIFAYKKNILMMQGIIFRTDIFAPVPIGLDLFKPSTHEGKVVFIYDDELSLPSGRLPFAMWREKINSTISKGSRIILARGYMPRSERNDNNDRERFVICFNEGNNPPAPEGGIYSVEEYVRERSVTVRRTLNLTEYNAEFLEALKKDKDYKDNVLGESYDFNTSKRKYTHFNGEKVWYDIPEDVLMQYETYSMVPEDVKKLYKRFDIPVWQQVERNGGRYLNGEWKHDKSLNWEKVEEKKKVRTMCIRYNPGDTVYAGWGKSFDDGAYKRDRQVPLTWLIYPHDSFILNYDRISLDDVEFYINDRSTRKDYVKALPLLWTIKKKLLEELEWEKKFVTFTEIEIKNETGIDSSIDLKPYIWKAIDWYKFEVVKVWKRPITSEDAKALRMIKQEAKRVIRDEAGFKALDTGVDNTKKTLVFKWSGNHFIITGATKAQFLEQILLQPSLERDLRKPWRGVPKLSKARINRDITDTKNEIYIKQAAKTPGKLIKAL